MNIRKSIMVWFLVNTLQIYEKSRVERKELILFLYRDVGNSPF